MVTLTTIPLKVIIMAAGKGTRLKSSLPKVLHPLMGKPLLFHVLDLLKQVQQGINLHSVDIIVGHGRDQVMAAVERQYPQGLSPETPVRFIVQEPQKGTGHAVLQVIEADRLSGMMFQGQALILSGDVPLLRQETLRALIESHRVQSSVLTLLSAQLDNPTGYGRILYDAQGQVSGIVEEKDATPAQKLLTDVNTGIYCMDWPKLSELLVKRAQARHAYQNAQGELYLTDLVQDTVEAAYPVKACQLQEPTEMIGVNSRQDLAQCHQYLAQRQVQRWMSDGVTIIDPSSTWIGPDVSLGPDTILYPGCWLEGHVSVGQGCVLGPDVTVQGDVTFGNSVTVTHSVFHAKTSQIRVADGAMVGPFAHIRDGSVGSHIGSGSRIGNFVELKNAQIAEQTNVAHLSYLGDVEVGRQVNIGAGTIVANYDALQEQKHQTRIEDHVKVGSNTVLVAPVTLGQEAFIAAGSVITKSVEPGALGIARGRQENRTGWVYQQREQNQVNAPCQK